MTGKPATRLRLMAAAVTVSCAVNRDDGTVDGAVKRRGAS